MGKFRTILASLIALAVAAAPVAATLVTGARPARAAEVHDCHRMAQERHHQTGCTDDATTGHHCHDSALQDMDRGSCPDCQDQHHNKKCIGDGGKCCKLTGMVAVLPVVAAPVQAVDLSTNLPKLVGWQMRPSPPPPRA
jgi:hypothetical protein